MHKINDLVEDNEGDKAIVVAVDEDERTVRVEYDCTTNLTPTGWLRADLFSNISERVRELDARPQKRVHYIDTLTLTCGGCPTQYEGTTTEGERIYIRYRWGHLRLDIDGHTVLAKSVGDDLDGVMSYDDVMMHVGEILRER